MPVPQLLPICYYLADIQEYFVDARFWAFYFSYVSMLLTFSVSGKMFLIALASIEVIQVSTILST